MKQLKLILFIAFIIILSIDGVFSQEHDKPRIGFLVSTATIQYGVPTSALVTPTWYLTMRGEGFIEKNISIAGGIDISLPKKFRYDDILENYSVNFGLNYHFIKNHFDAYIGFQPGVSLSKTTIIDYKLKDKDKFVWSPLITSTVGARYYLSWIAHAFTSVTYNYGFQISNQTSLPMSEFRFALGVGININTVNKK